jgi:hypothetical protein
MNIIDTELFEQETVVTKTTEKPATANDPEIALDPKLEKEFFLDSIIFHDHTITVKTLGTGPTAPVVVYIDDKRWEMFPGPKRALQAAKKHVKTMAKNPQNDKYSTKEITQESKEMKSFMESLLEGDLKTAREITRNTLYQNAQTLINKRSKKIAEGMGQPAKKMKKSVAEKEDKKDNDKEKKTSQHSGTTIRRGVRVNLRST